MTPDHREDNEDEAAERTPDAMEVSRRRFLAGGVALGATVVWAAPFPFAEAPIGQILPVDDATAAGVPAGPTGPGPQTSTAKIILDRRVVIGDSGRLPVKILCVGGATLEGKVLLRRAGSKEKLGKALFSIPAGDRDRVRIKISDEGLERLAKHGKLEAEVIVATPGSPNKSKDVRLVLS